MPRPQKRKAVVLLSGGIDSATVLAIAVSAGHDVHAITFDYHQRHARELASARAVAAACGVDRHLVVAFDLREIGGSALTSSMAVPKSAGRSAPSIPVTYVPARNTIFLSFALAWAEVLEAPHIYIGANAVDYSGYPDCRPAYLRAFSRMANLATRASVEGGLRFRIHAPLISLTKAETISKGLALGMDYGLTWSCYDPQPVRESQAGRTAGMTTTGGQAIGPGVVPCGRCDSCRIRRKGFREAGIRDPLLSWKKTG